MALPTDLSFMDLLLEKEDNLLSFNKDLISDDMKFCLDSKSINSDDWTNGVDFLDTLLEMESDNIELENSNLLGDNLPDETPAPESVVESSSCSDSGVSCDQQLSPMVQDVEEEEDDVEEVIFEEEVYTEPDPVVKEEIIEVEDEELPDVNPTVEVTNSQRKTPVVKLNLPRVTPAAMLPTVRVKPVSVAAPRRVIRVTPLQSTNPRSILIPVNNVGGVRTIKIINATAKGQSAISVRAKQLLNNSAVIRTIDGDSVTAPSDRSEHNMYPRLRLNAEERRLMIKEGVTLPSHYPLTKHEERELKRIRRKIRNKISAQDSRKRKKEYVDGLEDRVKQCTEENQSLLKRLKALQTQNQSLSTQLRRLHAALARGTAQTAQPATCLMVLVLSLALVVAPNLRPPPSRSATAHDLDLPQDSKQSPLAGRSRSLLFSKPSDHSPLENLLNQDTINEEEIDKVLLANLEGMLQYKKAKLDDHDYSQAVQTESKGTKRYIEPDIDDSWPPPKIPRADVSNRPEQALHNKTRAPPEERKYIVELPE